MDVRPRKIHLTLLGQICLVKQDHKEDYLFFLLYLILGVQDSINLILPNTAESDYIHITNLKHFLILQATNNIPVYKALNYWLN